MALLARKLALKRAAGRLPKESAVLLPAALPGPALAVTVAIEGALRALLEPRLTGGRFQGLVRPSLDPTYGVLVHLVMPG